ncbi:MAG: class I SAM-dependent methyltransferase [Promethearchaeota archaeon]
MENWQIFLIILGICIIVFLVFALPRKKHERVPSIEGLDIPEVAKAFETMAKTPPFILLRRKIISQLKKLEPKGTLIDLGCGSGNLLLKIAKLFPNLELIGIDISFEILSLAEKRLTEHSFDSKITFKVGNVENIPAPDNSVDFIVSSFSLHHWSEPLKVFKEIYRVLNENGTCLIFDFRRNSRNFFYGLLTFATKVVVPKPLKKISEPLGSLKAAYTANEITKILSHTQFSEIKINPYLAWMFIVLSKY